MPTAPAWLQPAYIRLHRVNWIGWNHCMVEQNLCMQSLLHWLVPIWTVHSLCTARFLQVPAAIKENPFRDQVPSYLHSRFIRCDLVRITMPQIKTYRINCINALRAYTVYVEWQTSTEEKTVECTASVREIIRARLPLTREANSVEQDAQDQSLCTELCPAGKTLQTLLMVLITVEVVRAVIIAGVRGPAAQVTTQETARGILTILRIRAAGRYSNRSTPQGTRWDTRRSRSNCCRLIRRQL